MVAFFVFKQKTAYEIEYGLVGSEMCIRDSELSDRGECGGGPLQDDRRSASDRANRRSGNCQGRSRAADPFTTRKRVRCSDVIGEGGRLDSQRCLLYTSDAADERSRVDLGGRRIIKKIARITFVAGTAFEPRRKPVPRVT